MHHGQQVVYVKLEQLGALAEFARSDPKLQYEAIVDGRPLTALELLADGAFASTRFTSSLPQRSST